MNKKLMRTVMSLLLSFVMVLGIMPAVTVSAEADYLFGMDVLWVGGVSLRTNGQVVYGDTGTATLSGTADAPVLTLNEFSYTGPGYDLYNNERKAAFCYKGDKDLTIILVGENKFVQQDNNLTHSWGMNIYNTSIPTVTITGSEGDSLSVKAGDTTYSSEGLYGAFNLKLTGGEVIYIGGTVTENDSFQTPTSYGILQIGGHVEITGGKLITKGNTQAVGSITFLGDAIVIKASENIDGADLTACTRSELDGKKYVEITAPVTDSETSGSSSGDGYVKDITGTAEANAENNTFEPEIVNNSELKTLLSLTDEEVAEGVNVWLDIQDIGSSVSKTDKTLVQNASDDYTVGMYLDINLFKKVGSNAATKITETNGKIKASIVIPESLWKSGRTFELIRVHDGEAAVISGTYDESTHVFTFETDKFSTYALAYKDATSSDNNSSSSDSSTSSDSSSSNSSNSTQSTAPKTGDPNDIRVWYLLLIASLGGLGLLGYSKKKKVND